MTSRVVTSSIQSIGSLLQIRGALLPEMDFYILFQKNDSEFTSYSSDTYSLSHGPYEYSKTHKGMCTYYFTTTTNGKKRREVSLLLRPEQKNISIDTLYAGCVYTSAVDSNHIGDRFVFIPKLLYYFFIDKLMEYNYNGDYQTLSQFILQKNKDISSTFYLYSTHAEASMFGSKGYSYCDLTQACGTCFGGGPSYMFGSICTASKTDDIQPFRVVYPNESDSQSQSLARRIVNQSSNSTQVWYIVSIVLLCLLGIVLIIYFVKQFFNMNAGLPSQAWFVLPENISKPVVPDVRIAGVPSGSSQGAVQASGGIQNIMNDSNMYNPNAVTNGSDSGNINTNSLSTGSFNENTS